MNSIGELVPFNPGTAATGTLTITTTWTSVKDLWETAVSGGNWTNDMAQHDIVGIVPVCAPGAFDVRTGGLDSDPIQTYEDGDIVSLGWFPKSLKFWEDVNYKSGTTDFNSTTLTALIAKEAGKAIAVDEIQVTSADDTNTARLEFYTYDGSSGETFLWGMNLVPNGGIATIRLNDPENLLRSQYHTKTGEGLYAKFSGTCSACINVTGRKY